MTIVCNCATGGKCEIHPKAKDTQSDNKTLDISPEDKLQLKILEGEALKAQLQLQNQQMMAQQAHNQVQAFAAAVFEKLGIKQEDYVLDLSQLKVVAKSLNPAQKG